uniref:Cytochrome c oxidase subunit 2 n=1 Tax=Plectrocnemia tsukuiensis TaxID=623670 RepID=A0A9E8LNL2_9NEOP|nr:cytochrome c oxidase subunit II [Plectrocnemia tsukuiensis]UZZ43690.1 cytochrome c oxidase subunit II [Plectrocnemia tsukuiensis]
MPTWFNIHFQNSNSPMMENLIFFHENNMMILMMITSFVMLYMMMMTKNKMNNLIMMENQNIEMMWTLIPMMLLMLIAIPSLNILYMIDEINSPSITIKMMGNQWYWSYEYSDFKKIEFDSFMMVNKNFRLLEVDNNIILPMNLSIKSLISSNDVIHSWTIPSLGVKTDALPNRLNQLSFIIYNPGIMFGQCSEICGINHSFMPICIESINVKHFIKWINKF